MEKQARHNFYEAVLTGGRVCLERDTHGDMSEIEKHTVSYSNSTCGGNPDGD